MMGFRITASFVFAALALIVVASGSADQKADMISLVEIPQYAAVSAALESDSAIASSTMIPVFVAEPSLLPDMVDIAADSAEKHKSQQTDTPKPQTQEESGAQSVSNVLPPLATAETVQWVDAYIAYAESRLENDHRIAGVLAKHAQLHTFQAILQPAGFPRPRWQNLSNDAMLIKPENDIEPFVVMIDPGHGGTDQGAKGHNGLLEKDLTLDIARRIRFSLSEFKHIDVKLTRNHDYGLSRLARVNAIKRGKADMVISLHFNHLPQSDLNLVESYYAGPENIQQSLLARHLEKNAKKQGSMHRTISTSADDIDLSFTEGSARLANTLHEHIFAEVSVNDNSAQNAGVKEETLFVLTQSFIPSVLMELSCLSHAPEAQRLEHDNYRNRLAQALVEGIREYHDSLQRAPLRKRGDVGV